MSAELQKGIMAVHHKAPVTNDQMVERISGWIVGVKSFVVIMIMIISSVITGTVAMTRLFIDVESVQRDITANRDLMKTVVDRQQNVLQRLSAIDVSMEDVNRQLDRLENRKP